ncbi:MAG: translational GTPase TypA [Candidatus Cloacimonadota bacterium]|nr:MAG: translational GTPase TypA [Candidatus Cloacimonadota bacterium]PIE78421.1 MAG: translational GTPase TypA [Candidatus Delongbacteria bacterium]
MKNFKNIAIIAHVDHGKTTLVDAALKQTGAFRKNQKVEERVMDSNDIERERGITIFSKNASLFYKGIKINIIDTPGHADFGGEVQRILKMVDSVLLLVDAFEGPMPQTKYVLKKSLELGLKPIVVINKIDRPNSNPQEVLDKVFDLFVELNANDEQLDFPVVYASAKSGIAKYELNDDNEDIIPLLDTIIENVDEPEGDNSLPLQFLASNVEYDPYIGKIGTGKIHNGVIKNGDEVYLLKRDGSRVKNKITKIFIYDGLKKESVESAEAGDIVSIAGIPTIDIGETVADIENPIPLPLIDIDEPTLAMNFIVNDSPFAGKEGKWVTSRNIWDRLQKELQTNVSLVVEATDSADTFLVKGRGELQMAILIENMRREGYEFAVSKPKVIFRELNGKKTEPIELALIDVADEYAGVVIEKLGMRKGEMINMIQGTDGYTRIEFKVPARGLVGFSSEFLTETRGTGILNHSFYEYEYYKGDIPGRNRGVLVSLEKGTAMAFSLWNLQERGTIFIDAGTEVYGGMIVGQHIRENDLDVNVLKNKKLTNVRASGSDDAIKLIPPKKMALEQALEFIEDDELIEITPLNIRLRKRDLDPNDRKRAASKKKKERLAAGK